MRSKLFFLLVVLAMLVSTIPGVIPAMAQDGEEEFELSVAPLNPDFEEYLKNPEYHGGYVPTTMDLSHVDSLGIARESVMDIMLPASFDWRGYGKVTPVKDQDGCGTCWIFSTLAVLESAVLLGGEPVFDFSEQSIALGVDRSRVSMFDDPTDPCMAGGNSFIASEVLIKKGSVLETCNPYDPDALKCGGT